MTTAAESRVACAARERGVALSELEDRRVRKALTECTGERISGARSWGRVRQQLRLATQAACGSHPGRCRSCGAPVIWVHTARGARQPVDPLPHPAGTIRVTRVGRNLHGRVAKTGRPEPGLRRAHFATCPGARRERSAHLTPVPYGVPLCDVCGTPITPVDGRMVHPCCEPEHQAWLEGRS